MLSQIKIYIDSSVGDKLFQSHFNYRVFFIVFFLSRQLRKLKIDSKDIKTIDIVFGGDVTQSVEIAESRIIIHTSFDLNFYSSMSEYEKCKYYSLLINQAFNRLAEIQNIPYSKLKDLINKLQQDKFIYRWKFKTISLPLNNLKINFFCSITTNDFTISVEIYNLKGKSLLLEGIVIRTKPDEIFFSHISNKIRVERDNLFITTKWGGWI